MEQRPARRQRYTVRALLVVASVLAVLAILAVWANRQVLNADNWSDTSSALLEHPEVRTQLSSYLVDQVYANVDVTAELQDALPKRLAPLAGPAAGAVRQLAERSTNRFLERPRTQQLWKAANKATAQQFIDIADGSSRAITTQGDAVVLDLRTMVIDLVQRLGLPGRVVGKIPPEAGRLKILDSSQVTTLQNGTSFLRGLAFVLPPLSFGLFGLAIFLSRGRRRQTLMWVGVDLVAAGVVVLVAANVLGDSVVSALATTDAVKPAADATWSIATRILRDVAQATIIGAIPLLVGAWLAGPMKPAVAARRAMAPTLRDHPGTAYAVLAVLLLAIVAWGPIPATQKPIPMLVMAALAVLGLHILRQQTAAEFPQARPGEGIARAREQVRAAWPAGRRRVVPAAEVEEGARLQSLERLATLHDRGALSDDEFATEKAALLSGANGSAS